MPNDKEIRLKFALKFDEYGIYLDDPNYKERRERIEKVINKPKTNPKK